MEIKDIIRNRRLELGLTMKELAARVGVSEGTISRWESGGIANMKRDKVALLSQVLGIPIDQLMGWEEDSQDGTPAYYMDPDASDLAQFLFEHPEYKVLFDGVRKVRKEDLEVIKALLEKFS